MPTLATEDRLIAKSTLRHRPISADTRPTRVQPITTRASRTSRPPITRTKGKSLAIASLLPQKRHWMLDFGLGLLAALTLILLAQALLNWSFRTWDDLHYGMPRTFQVDAYVGHEKGPLPSHFIAMNLHGQIEIIELPGGDSAHTRLYLGPLISGNNADLVPVTLQFVARSSDRKHPDMLVEFQTTKLLFRNQSGSFIPPTNPTY